MSEGPEDNPDFDFDGMQKEFDTLMRSQLPKNLSSATSAEMLVGKSRVEGGKREIARTVLPSMRYVVVKTLIPSDTPIDKMQRRLQGALGELSNTPEV